MVKLFKVPPPVKNKLLLAVIIPLPPILKLEVAVPINLFGFVMVTIPFKASVFPAPIAIIPIGCKPPAIVAVPLDVTDEESVRDGATKVPAVVVFKKVKLLTVAGNNVPVV